MASRVPPELAQDAALLEATLRPKLAAIGVEHVEIAALGPKGRAQFWVGYRLAQGIQVAKGEVRETVNVHWPAAVDRYSLQICKVEDLPALDDDPRLRAAKKALARPAWVPFVLMGVLAVAAIGFVLSQTVLARGDLLASAPLRGAGEAVVRFTSTGEPVALWADLDGRWTGSADSSLLNDILPVHYEIDFVKSGRIVRHVSVDTQVRRPVSRKICTVAPDCEIYLMDLAPFPPGPIEARVRGTPRGDVTAVAKMFLYVREVTPW